MPEAISITDDKQEISLNTNKEDVLASVVKALGSIVPLGGVFGEILATTIPNQKMERVIDFLRILSYKLENVERKIDAAELRSEQFTDLLGEAIVQASKSLTTERREYLAALLTKSLTDQELDHIGKKKLLYLLDQLNDAEIIYLKSYSFRMRSFMQEDFKRFHKAHEEVLEPLPPGIQYHRNEPLEITNKKALKKGYIAHLLSLALIEERYRRAATESDEPRDFDWETGKLKSDETSCSRLGRMLLEYLGLTDVPTVN